MRVVGATADGLELRVEHGRGCAPAVHDTRPAVSVSLAVPEVPVGAVDIVLSRWSDMPGVLIYPSLSGGAPRPQWVHLELVPDGLRLVVKWEHEGEPRDYTFEWTRKILPA